MAVSTECHTHMVSTGDSIFSIDGLRSIWANLAGGQKPIVWLNNTHRMSMKLFVRLREKGQRYNKKWFHAAYRSIGRTTAFFWPNSFTLFHLFIRSISRCLSICGRKYTGQDPKVSKISLNNPDSSTNERAISFFPLFFLQKGVSPVGFIAPFQQGRRTLWWKGRGVWYSPMRYFVIPVHGVPVWRTAAKRYGISVRLDREYVPTEQTSEKEISGSEEISWLSHLLFYFT